MADTYSIGLGFDAASLASLHKIEEFDAWLAAHLQVAMKESIAELQDASQTTMMSNFIDPTGAAETKWRRTINPFRSILTNMSKYGQRLNFGFSGMTDSLGRYFTAWPTAIPAGYHWAETAVEMATPYVQEIFHREVSAAIDEVS